MYRGLDSRLERTVAVKVLPRHLFETPISGNGSVRDQDGVERAIQPDVSITLVRQSLGAMAPEVDRRLAGSSRKPGSASELTRAESIRNALVL